MQASKTDNLPPRQLFVAHKSWLVCNVSLASVFSALEGKSKEIKFIILQFEVLGFKLCNDTMSHLQQLPLQVVGNLTSLISKRSRKRFIYWFKLAAR